MEKAAVGYNLQPTAVLFCEAASDESDAAG